MFMFWPKNRFLVGWGCEDKTTGVLTVVNPGLSVRTTCWSSGHGLIEDTGCFLLPLFSIAVHYFGERKHSVLLCRVLM